MSERYDQLLPEEPPNGDTQMCRRLGLFPPGLTDYQVASLLGLPRQELAEVRQAANAIRQAFFHGQSCPLPTEDATKRSASKFDKPQATGTSLVAGNCPANS